MTTPTIDASDFTVDFVRHVPSGEIYVAETHSLWSDAEPRDCIGIRITGMGGPLTQDEQDYIRQNPQDWFVARDIDLDAVNANLSADGEWQFADTLL